MSVLFIAPFTVCNCLTCSFLLITEHETNYSVVQHAVEKRTRVSNISLLHDLVSGVKLSSPWLKDIFSRATCLASCHLVVYTGFAQLDIPILPRLLVGLWMDGCLGTHGLVVRAGSH